MGNIRTYFQIEIVRGGDISRDSQTQNTGRHQSSHNEDVLRLHAGRQATSLADMGATRRGERVAAMVFRVSQKLVELKACLQLYALSPSTAPQVLEGESAANLLTSGLPQVQELTHVSS